jgi:trk system potassium uptake protein TrkA
LLVGGGKVGSHLAREFSKAGHVVMVVEPDHDRARELSEETEVLVFEGDGTDVTLLRSADVHRADWALGVTGRDEVNFVACELALALGAKQVLARLNDPRNRATFDAVEIPVVAVTDLMVQVISQEVEVHDLSRIALIGHSNVSLCEVELPDGFREAPVQDLKLPNPAVIVTVLRGEEVLLPTGSTILQPGDRVTAVTTVRNEAALYEVLHGAPSDAHG